MKKLFAMLNEKMGENVDVVLVTVIASSGSTPRGSGARMIISKEGRLYGTIGGGAVEFEAEQYAAKVLEEKKSVIRDYTLAPNQVADLGMICGGAVTVWFQYIKGGDEGLRQLCGKAVQSFDDKEPSWIITELTPGSENRMGIYSKNTGLWGLDGLQEEDYKILFRSGSVQACVSGRTFYAEPLVQSGYVYVFGGGHVAQALVPLLTTVGFRCIVFEDRPQFASRALFPDARDIIQGDFQNIAKDVDIGGEDYVVTMTRSHSYDYDVERQALATKACYIGAIGSRKKIQAINEKLRMDGFSPEEIARIHSPIGLEIKAETPAEIAVSIAGEMILKRAERMGG